MKNDITLREYDEKGRRIGVYLAFVNHGDLLLVRKKNFWILPGGKIDLKIDKSYEDCLGRECREELDGVGVDRNSLKYFGDFCGISPFKQKPIRAKVYTGLLERDVLSTSNEIEEATWVPAHRIPYLSISPITEEVLTRLFLTNSFG